MLAELTVKRQAELLEVNRTSIYYRPAEEDKDIELMHRIDEIYTRWPHYGYRRIRTALKDMGYIVKYNNNYKNYKLLWDSDQVKELMQKLFRRNILPKIIALGIPMGIISALQKNRWPDHLVTFFYIAGLFFAQLCYWRVVNVCAV